MARGQATAYSAGPVFIKTKETGYFATTLCSTEAKNSTQANRWGGKIVDRTGLSSDAKLVLPTLQTQKKEKRRIGRLLSYSHLFYEFSTPHFLCRMQSSEFTLKLGKKNGGSILINIYARVDFQLWKLPLSSLTKAHEQPLLVSSQQPGPSLSKHAHSLNKKAPSLSLPHSLPSLKSVTSHRWGVLINLCITLSRWVSSHNLLIWSKLALRNHMMGIILYIALSRWVNLYNPLIWSNLALRNHMTDRHLSNSPQGSFLTFTLLKPKWIFITSVWLLFRLT